MATEGSCFCGNLKISYTGDPALVGLCHCVDCRKISGSTHSFNVVVPAEAFKSTGPTKAIAKTADSGATITSYFCPDCGTTVWRETPTFGNNLVIKAGVLNDPKLHDSSKPVAELFASKRVAWQPAIEGAGQKEAM